MRYKSLFWNLGGVFLGIVFIFYGTVKLLGGQFIFSHDWTIDGSTTDGPTLVWRFFGYSSLYGRLIGLAEVTPGLLLLAPRTRFLGAVLLLPVAANITVMDFCYSFPPVKYFALALTTGCLTLVLSERTKLSRALAIILGPAQSSDDEAVFGMRPTRVSWWLAGILLGAILAFFLTNLLVTGLSAGPAETAYAACQQHGWKRQELNLVRWKTDSWSGLNVTGNVDIHAAQGDQSKTILVTLWRPNAFVTWRVKHYEEKPWDSSSNP